MTKRIDEVGPIGNIRSALAGAKGAAKGAFSGGNPFSGAIQGAKNAYADKNGAIAVKQWADKIRNEWSRQANVYGNTEDGFKAFVSDYLRLPDFVVPPRPAPAAPPPSSPGAPSGGGKAAPGKPASPNLGSSNPMYNTTVTAKRPTPPPPPPRPTASFTPQQSNYNVNVKSAPTPAPANPAPKAKPAPASSQDGGMNPANVKPAAPEGNAPTPSAAPTPAVSTHADLAASLSKHYGFSKNDANEAVNTAVAKLGPGASESDISREAIRSLRRPSSDDRNYRPAVESISPSLGRFGDQSFSHLLEEGLLDEADAGTDWLDAVCMDAAKQFLQKNPITFQASCKYKLGTTQYRDYLQELRAQHGVNRPTAPATQFGGAQRPAASTSSYQSSAPQQPTAPAPTAQSAPQTQAAPQAQPASVTGRLTAAFDAMGRDGSEFGKEFRRAATLRSGQDMVRHLAAKTGKTPEEIAALLANAIIKAK